MKTLVLGVVIGMVAGVAAAALWGFAQLIKWWEG